MSDAESKVKAIKFEVGKLYKTRSGEVRRVVCLDCPGEWPIISVCTDPKSGCAYTGHSSDGFYHPDRDGLREPEHPRDLIAEHREPREFLLKGGSPHAPSYIHDGQALLADGETIRVREVLDHD